MRASSRMTVLAALLAACAGLAVPAFAADAPVSLGARVRGAVSDTRITAATKLRLLRDSRTPALDIGVETQGGVVTLSGTVTSLEAKVAAGEDAKKVSGVGSVLNQLEVVGEGSAEEIIVRGTGQRPLEGG